MTDIKIVSASAGSGKTYRLTTELVERIRRRTVRPEAIVATTFTRKAAAELQERVRTRLVSDREDDLLEQATLLSAAWIGTVHSVCGRLVSEFALEKGLSPDVRVIDEESAREALGTALSRELTADEEEAFAALSERLGNRHGFGPKSSLLWDWQSDVRRVIEQARANAMDAEGVRRSGQRSLEQLAPLFTEAVGDVDQLARALVAELEAFLGQVNQEVDTTIATAGAVQTVTGALLRLRDGNPLRWATWAKLSKLKTGKNSRDLAIPVQQAAAVYDRHPDLWPDVRRATELVFELAARTMTTYQEYKEAYGLMDFGDQERLSLELLEDPDVQARLRGRIDLVLVDEFQDTSPIQLAILLRLADLAPSSLWVGDQKQSIYGFRDTDPALMDAALELVLGTEEPETLEISRRSTPDLVDLTSDLFGPAFASRGIPEPRVRLQPWDELPRERQQAVLEYWPVVKAGRGRMNNALRGSALAAGIRQLLAEEAPAVFDRSDRSWRSLRARDVAILCRTNEACEEVAAALNEHSIPVVVKRRKGLMDTREARLVATALRLWIDPRDGLAAATLSRLLEYPDLGPEWLARLLDAPGQDAFAGSAVVTQLLESRGATSDAGAVAAMDRIIEALDVRNVCRRWGKSFHRLANLEALRAHALGFHDRCLQTGAASTPSALVRYLDRLKEEGQDSPGVARDLDAVTVSTQHGAKGLEWPVVVLYGMKQSDDPRRCFGVHVESDRPRIDPEQPLADRWVRLWPYPFGAQKSDLPLLDRLEQNEARIEQRNKQEREDLRLLYVAWTRARERLILVADKGKLCDKTLLEYLNVGGRRAVYEPEGEVVQWGAAERRIRVRELQAGEPIAVEEPEESGYPERDAREYPTAYLSPSRIEGTADVGDPVMREPAIRVVGTPVWNNLGNAIHGFLAADSPALAFDEREAMAFRLLNAWLVASHLEPASLLEIADRLHRCVSEQWPEAERRHEWPLQMRTAAGPKVRGEADLVLRTPGGLVIIDHKAVAGDETSALKKAGGFGGQLTAYAEALERATGEPVVATLIHLPLHGILAPITPRAAMYEQEPPA